jgi:hypothetical protein
MKALCAVLLWWYESALLCAAAVVCKALADELEVQAWLARCSNN